MVIIFGMVLCVYIDGNKISKRLNRDISEVKESIKNIEVTAKEVNVTTDSIYSDTLKSVRRIERDISMIENQLRRDMEEIKYKLDNG